MRKFNTKKNKLLSYDYIIISVIIFTVLFLYLINKNVSYKIQNIAISKLDEITTLYVKKNILPEKIDLNKLIPVTLNNKQEIVYVDTDVDYANSILRNVVTNIQNNILKLEKGNVQRIENLKELKSINNHLYISVPLLLSLKGSILSNIGPKIPIKLSFYENALGTIETKIINYGINNALLKVYLTITINQKINIPYEELGKKTDFEMLLGAKVITGIVPTIYGGTLTKQTEIID